MLIAFSASVCCVVCSSLLGKGVGGYFVSILWLIFACFCNLFPPALTTWPCPKAWPRLVIVYYWGLVFYFWWPLGEPLFSLSIIWWALVFIIYVVLLWLMVERGCSCIYLQVAIWGVSVFAHVYYLQVAVWGVSVFSLLWGLYVGCMLLFMFWFGFCLSVCLLLIV